MPGVALENHAAFWLVDSAVECDNTHASFVLGEATAAVERYGAEGKTTPLPVSGRSPGDVAGISRARPSRPGHPKPRRVMTPLSPAPASEDLAVQMRATKHISLHIDVPLRYLIRPKERTCLIQSGNSCSIFLKSAALPIKSTSPMGS